MSAATDEACRLAINLARNAGYAVFPCGDNKRPTRPGEAGVLHGFHDATKDPAEIAFLWAHWPGPLIGIATGEASGIAVLDIDSKHPEALAWWQENHSRLLPTRCFATRSGGLHLYYQHRDGIRNTQGRLCPGVDSRGDGGYVIHWFSAGFECRCHEQPQPFPDWLHHELTYRPAPDPAPTALINPERAIEGVLRKLAATREGERNGVLFWAACKLKAHGLHQPEIEALVLPIAISIGLTEHETRATTKSAMGRSAA
jgi:hypothetical protein